MKENKLITKGKALLDFYLLFDMEGMNTLQVTFSALLGILVSTVKILLGVFLGSAVWVFSGIYSIGLGIALFLLLKDIVTGATSEKKNCTVLFVAIILMVSAFVFDICAMFRQFQGDMGEPFPTWLVIVLSIYFATSYVISIIGLFQTRTNKALSFYAFRVICISGSLMNIVLMQRMILSVSPISAEWVVAVNSIFSYFIGGTLLITALILMLRAIFAMKQD